MHFMTSKKLLAEKVIRFSTKASAKIEVNGINLHWQRMGEGSHVVLFLPGLLGTIATNWAPVWKRMDTKKFTLVGWDPPGYGKSRPPNRNVFTKEFCLQRDAQLAAELMAKLGHKKYSLVGWSNGGTTGAHLAIEFPERIQKLVMANAPFRFSSRSVKVAQMLSHLENWSPSQQRSLVKTYERPYLDKLLKDWAQLILVESQSQAYFQKMEAKLKEVTAPTLYIQGGKDIVIPPGDAEGYKERIANFRIEKVLQAPHDHLEFLDEFVTLTESFLSEEEATAA